MTVPPAPTSTAASNPVSPGPAASSSSVSPGCGASSLISHSRTGVEVSSISARERSQPAAIVSQFCRLERRYSSASTAGIVVSGTTPTQTTD